MYTSLPDTLAVCAVVDVHVPETVDSFHAKG